MTEESYTNTISGLLRRRHELMGENSSLRERMAVIANDVEAIDRVLDGLGYAGELEGRAVRQERIILFYRNEMKEFLINQLREADRGGAHWFLRKDVERWFDSYTRPSNSSLVDDKSAKRYI